MPCPLSRLPPGDGSARQANLRPRAGRDWRGESRRGCHAAESREESSQSSRRRATAATDPRTALFRGWSARAPRSTCLAMEAAHPGRQDPRARSHAAGARPRAGRSRPPVSAQCAGATCSPAQRSRPLSPGVLVQQTPAPLPGPQQAPGRQQPIAGPAPRSASRPRSIRRVAPSSAAVQMSSDSPTTLATAST